MSSAVNVKTALKRCAIAVRAVQTALSSALSAERNAKTAPIAKFAVPAVYAGTV